MRKIPQTLLIMSMFAPWGAHALGIGEIIVHSSLDESLNAEIPLVTSNDEDVSDIRVTLASPEIFARAHIERSYALTKLGFTTRKNPDGRLSIYVSSKNAIREPILDFIVEVYWPQGRQFREFTALLDPPANSVQQASEDNEELPKTSSYSPDEDQPVRAHSLGEPVGSWPRRTIRNVHSSSGIHAEASVPITGTQYGPVERNETLWNIAQKFQQPNVSQRQMINALYKGNPNAFYKASMDALKAGTTITIPDQASIMRIAGLGGATQESGNTARFNAKSKTAAEPLASGANEEPGNLQGQLKLLPPSTNKSLSAETGSVKQLKTGRTKEESLELSDTAKQENENFRKRLTDLEQQMSAMQKLLALKEEQIVTLQTRLATPAREAEQPTRLATIPPSANVGKIAPPPEAEQAKTPPDAQSQEASQAASPNPAARPPIPASPKPVQAASPKPTPRPSTQNEPVKSTVTANEEGFLAETLNQPYYLVAGASALLLLGLAWQFIRRRSAMIEDPESILTMTEKEKGSTQLKAVPEPVDTIQNIMTEQPTVFRSSFLSEFTPSDFDALSGEMSEVDPVSEADVYLAYGRYKQAEDLIVGAIEKNPERDDCRLKLFEIHYATENASAFEKCAELLAPTHQQTKPEFWEKVVEMGRELCPRNPLFKFNPQPSANVAASESSIPPKQLVDTQENIYHFDDEDVLENLDHPTAPPIAGKTQQGQLEQVRPSIAYDFFSTEDKVSDEEKPNEELEKVPEQTDFEHTISFEKPKTDPVEELEEVEEIVIPDESMEEMLAKLGALSGNSYPQPSYGAKEHGQTAQSPMETKPAIAQMELENQDNSLEFQEDIPNTGHFEFDDIGTKLDLANAYFDLGDSEAARAILLTVVQLGNDNQKEAANSLLTKLDSKE